VFVASAHFDPIYIAGWCYILVAIAFIIRTYWEGRSSKEGGPVWRVIGLLLCVIWPILIGLVGFEALRQRKDL
jgi:hypothetical protein